MKTLKFAAVILLMLLFSSTSYSQRGRGIKELLNQYGITTYSYLLTANRPSYSVDAEIVEKNDLELNTGFDGGAETNNIPLSLNYGIAKNVEIFGGIDLFSQSYNFTDKKISGVGDSHIGVKYMFQNSDKFSHVFQALIKIPTASESSELGTGRMDIHFGVAQSYHSKILGYSLSAELNLLHRRNFPAARKYPAAIQAKIDSLESSYNYKYEPEVVLSFGPDFTVSKRMILYLGYSFDRNTRLNYNSSLLYGGMGYNVSNRVGISLGGSYGLETAGTWGLSTGLNVLLN